MVDVERMKQIVSQLHVANVNETFGDPGVEAFHRVTSALSAIYRVHDPGLLVGRFIVFSKIDSDGSNGQGVITPTESLAIETLSGKAIEVLADGRHRLIPSLSQNIQELSQNAIVYEFHNRTEKFLFGIKAAPLINPIQGCVSVFSRPTFTALESALEAYRVHSARESSCLILAGVWDSPARVCFKNKPEATMRQSLNQYLSNVLQDAEVRPEQNVNESKPVDIRVGWLNSVERDIIEIKWVGASREKGKITTQYADARARAGAKQLAEYLDLSGTWAPGLRTRGYLVIFDGRRLGLTDKTQAVSRTNGLHFEHVEIEYVPDYAAARSDFATPLRFFMRPTQMLVAA